MKVDYKLLSKMFNSGTLSDIANGNFSLIKNISQQYSGILDITLPLSQIYENVYQSLILNYKNEYIFKNLIAENLLLQRHSLAEATMISEFRVGTNKADCVLFNGISTCYEIKTDFDSLIRLSDQLNSYNQIFDEVYVVSTLKHLKNIELICPPNVGIMILEENLEFSSIKKAIPKETSLDIALYMQSLRKEEYLDIVLEITGENILAPNTKIYDICLEIIQDSLTQGVDVNKLIRDTIKKYRKNDASFTERIPSYLKNASISYKFSQSQINNLIDSFNKDVRI